MVNYQIGVKNNGYSITFDLTKLISDKKDKNLPDIDKLTSDFKSEEELKHFLVICGVMPQELLKDKINIVYKNNKTLPIVLQEQQVYINRLFRLAASFKRYISLDDPNFRSIVGFFPALTKMLRNKAFLEELIEQYSSIPNQEQNILELKSYLNSKNLDPNNIVATIALFDLLKKVLLKKEKNNNNEIIGYKVNYRELRNLSFIIYRYNERIRLNKLREELKREQAQKELEELFSPNDSNTWVLSSEGDPDFPFNSEEELIYITYMDNLPDEEHPHINRRR